MVHAILRGEVVETVQLMKISLLTHGSLLLLVLLHMSLGVRQVADTGGVSTANRALLEVTLQNITTRKSVAAENTHVGTVTRVAEEMALQMLRVKIGLGTVGARELAIRVLDRNDSALGGGGTSGRGSRATRSAGQDATTALATNNMSRGVALGSHGLRLHERATGTIRRRSTRLLGHDATRRHGTQHRRSAAARGRCGCERLLAR